MHTSTSLQPLGAARVLVEFEFYPGTPRERGTWYEPGDPGDDAEVVILGAVIGGHDVDAECFSDALIAQWEAAILAEKMEDLTDYAAIVDARREWAEAGVMA